MLNLARRTSYGCTVRQSQPSRRLALSNCSVPEIAAITGHSMATVQQILDAHYLGGRVELAESAIKKLSAVYG
jgi:hypothetical protein